MRCLKFGTSIPTEYFGPHRSSRSRTCQLLSWKTKRVLGGVHAIGALAAWGACGTRGQGITIGLLDTGVDPEHLDLKDKERLGRSLISTGRKFPIPNPVIRI